MDKSRVIRDNREFRRVYSSGKCYAGSVLVTYVLRSSIPGFRIGITTSKKIGGAVDRNRARRVIRAALSKVSPDIKSGYFIVFVARKRTCFVKSDVVLQEMEKQLQKAGMISK